MSKRTWALIAAMMVSIIYGVSFTIAKDVMPTYVKPYGFILLRVVGATFLFWAVSFFGPKEKIQLQDFPRIIAAAFFGVALNMLTFFKGLSFTSPISAAVIMVTTPIIVFDFIRNPHQGKNKNQEGFGNPARTFRYRIFNPVWQINWKCNECFAGQFSGFYQCGFVCFLSDCCQKTDG
jgi:hypothetical protein